MPNNRFHAAAMLTAAAVVLAVTAGNVAKTGDLNPGGLPSWPRYEPARSELTTFTADATAIIQPDAWKSRLALIERAVETHAPQTKLDSWLDEPKPTSWNKPGLSIPAARRMQESGDSRCKELARPPELDEDNRLRNQGWDLVGAYQGGWQMLVIRGTAGYDGMCRPLQYQDFVFVRGAFAGTLSPEAMDSRTDGALGRVFLQSNRELIAAYARYAETDPLCCPSRTTSVVFEIANAPPVVRPVSVSTSKQ